MSSISKNPAGEPQLSPLKQALYAIEDLQARLKAAEKPQNEPIAILGMGCRFPGAKDPAAFWELLREGRDAVREVPADRWDTNALYDADPDAPGKICTRWGGFLDGIDQFDPEFFGISPREAMFMDPQQRLLLEVAWEAMESAGQSPRDLAAGETGVFVGLTSDEYALLSYREGDLSRYNAYFASGIARSIAGGRISYFLGVEGPNMSIDTACSSSLVALHTACMHLRQKECRVALAGGVTVVLSPEIGIAFSKSHMMAPDGRCKAFDARANGYVRGEGCGMVVLKRLSDALADGDPILAVIRGSAINQDGRSSGMTAPNGRAQEAVIRTALQRAGVKPNEIGYVEAHGTGTSLGDPIEAHALARALGTGRDADNPLVIGAAKTNVGHLEAAAGVASLIKTVLVLQNEQIPPNLHFQTLNPHIDWNGVPVILPVEGRAWPRGQRHRIAGLSSFGFSGTNAHVIVEEAPVRPRSETALDRPLHLLTLSARTQTTLATLGVQYGKVLQQDSHSLADICYTANAGRAHFEYRVAVQGASATELREALEKALLGQRIVEREGVRPIFLFPGQGAQCAGMGRELYETQPVFRRVLDECAELLRMELDRPLLEVLWGAETRLLDQTAYSQPALFAVEYALAMLWKSWGIEPAALLGHSVGEYVAACVAGVYSLHDGLRLIAQRGRLMQQAAGAGAMTAVRASEAQVREALRGLERGVSIAALNAPGSITIAGYEAELRIAEERLAALGIEVQRLRVSHAFHSPQMDEMLDAFEAVVRTVEFRPPQVRLLSSVMGRAAGRDEMNQPGYWRRQVREPVRFQQAMEALGEERHAVFLEVGPGGTLSGLGQQCIESAQAIWLTSLRKERGAWQQMLDTLAQLYMRGADVDWAAFDRPYGRRKVPLPTYPFERQSYWVPPAAKRVRRTEDLRADPSAHGLDSVAETDPLRNWFYRVGWRQREIATAVGVQRSRRWVLLADKAGVAQALAERMRASGVVCEVLEEGMPVHALSDAAGFVDMRRMDASSDATMPACMALADLVRTVAQAGRREMAVWSVTRGARATGAENSAVAPWLVPVWAIGRTVASEHAEFWKGMVDLDPLADATTNAEMLWRHLADFDGEEEVAFRNGVRLVTRLERYVPAEAQGAKIRADAAYLITGGFGALGLEVARWMAQEGARNLILMGRTALPLREQWAGLPEGSTARQAAEGVLELERQGVHVETVAGDVASERAVKELVQAYEARGGAKIRGVVHAAGAMRHALVTETTEEVLQIAFQAKVQGTWALYRALMDRPLDFFVSFSSASAVLSSPRLGSYAAANAFLDAMAEFQSRQGRPSLSVNWGVWSGAGMAAMPEDAAWPGDASAITGMTVAQGLECLGRLMAGTTGQVCALPLDWKRWSEQYPAYMAKPFFSEVTGRTSGELAEPKQDLLERLKNTPEAARADVIRDFVQGIAGKLLGFPAAHAFDASRPLNELGLDSLMSLELRNAISAGVGQSLPATFLFNYPAVDDMTQYLVRLLFPETGTPDATPVDRRSTLDEIQDLSDEEVDRMLEARWGSKE